MSILTKSKLDATGAPIDPNRLYVCVESFFAGDGYVVTRAGMRLRGGNPAVQRGPTFFVVAATLDDDEIVALVTARNDAAMAAAHAAAVRAEQSFLSGTDRPAPNRR